MHSHTFHKLISCIFKRFYSHMSRRDSRRASIVILNARIDQKVIEFDARLPATFIYKLN